MTFERLPFFSPPSSPSPPSRRRLRSRTGRSCRTRPCSTTRRCCASTPAILRATRPPSPSTSSACSRRKAFRRRSSASDPKRSNLVARLKGNGKKKPLLVMGHSDVVTVDEAKWKFPPFSATRDGGYVYARGTVDDKDNLTAGADDDAAAEAAERAARSRRDLRLGSRRGRQLRASASATW